MPNSSHHLFMATRWLLKVVQAFCLLVMAVMGLGAGAVVVGMTSLGASYLGIPASIDGVARNDLLVIGALALLGVLLSFALILFIVRAVTAIVDSTISGDPFVNDNALRLTRIGILLVALIAVELATNVTVNGMMKNLADAHHVSVSAIGGFDFKPDISPIGLFTILLVFVLAQIFRRGSEMRAELEGTV